MKPDYENIRYWCEIPIEWSSPGAQPKQHVAALQGCLKQLSQRCQKLEKVLEACIDHRDRCCTVRAYCHDENCKICNAIKDCEEK